MRGALIVFGTLFVGLGLVGIFLPVLPTTPFLLLAAVCYARSSQRFYDWLLNNRWFGEYIRNYREGKGVHLHHKVSALVLLWGTIGAAVLLWVQNGWVRALLLVIAAGVTIHLVQLKTLRSE
ncbi:YbaN family protein [Levilinea saccharolytica]|uniref:Membrane protein n=1 Tax=Levilinea saccharolytica TaxID=229921 RepID=A0A0N8GMN4_9CHLR|nr:membrane protein [Levilinea saccharolytica]